MNAARNPVWDTPQTLNWAGFLPGWGKPTLRFALTMAKFVHGTGEDQETST